METLLCRRGPRLRVEYLVLPNGHAPAKEFLDGYARAKSKHGRAAQAVYASIELLCEGQRLPSTRFKKQMGDVFVLKGFQVRVYCFYAGDGRLVLAIKQQNAADPEEIKRAQRLHGEFMEALRPRRRS